MPPPVAIQAPSPWEQLTAALSRPAAGLGSQGDPRPARGAVKEAEEKRLAMALVRAGVIGCNRM
jgi:hypothetical protein